MIVKRGPWINLDVLTAPSRLPGECRPYAETVRGFLPIPLNDFASVPGGSVPAPVTEKRAVHPVEAGPSVVPPRFLPI
jgi:hypothetical protein